jgi:hypothetical protein
LSITGSNVVTLHVGFKGGKFVFPVIAGTGWEGGFVTYQVEMPPAEPLPGEEPEEEEWEEIEVKVNESLSFVRFNISAQGPPEFRPFPSGGPRTHRYVFTECRGYQPFSPPEYPGPVEKRIWLVETAGNCLREYQKNKEDITAAMALRGWYWVKPGKEVWVNNSEKECKKWGKYKPAMVHCDTIPEKDPHHVVLYGNYRFPGGSPANPINEPECDTLWAVITVAAPHKHEREPFFSSADEGDPCDWPQR